ncbi:MAG: acetyl-CoA hydrolase/transferase C-terminal domain-containing protein [Dehalococcoidia bacterium]
MLQFENFVAQQRAVRGPDRQHLLLETWGPHVFSGPGGQPTFAYAASVTNARLIIVLPSSQLVDGVRHSRIMAMLPEGSTVTTHRAFVDYVVTEQGIARLSGNGCASGRPR